MNDARSYDILLWKNKIWESKVSNSGDLAIIRNTFLKLKAQIPNARLHILSDDPEYVAREYGVVAHPISILRRPTEFIALLKRVDLVILGGGTVFQDDYFAGIIPINLSVPLLAKAMGKRVVCNAIGVGSDEEISRLGKALCRMALPRFDSVSVRDQESKDMVESWTDGKPAVHLTNDIAVDLPEADFERLAPILLEEGVDLGKDTVAIAARKVFHHEKTWLYFLPSSLRHRLHLHPGDSKQRLEQFKNNLAGLCDYIIERYGVQVLFVPFYGSGGSVDSSNQKTPTRLFTSGDNVFAQDVIGRIGARDKVKLLSRNYSPEELLAVIGRCKAMIGVPYHSVVFASSRNVPVIGIDYVSKVQRYLRILGLEEYTVDAGATLSTFQQKFDRLWAERGAIAEKLRTKNQELATLSDENIRIIREVLNGHVGS